VNGEQERPSGGVSRRARQRQRSGPAHRRVEVAQHVDERLHGVVAAQLAQRLGDQRLLLHAAAGASGEQRLDRVAVANLPQRKDRLAEDLAVVVLEGRNHPRRVFRFLHAADDLQRADAHQRRAFLEVLEDAAVVGDALILPQREIAQRVLAGRGGEHGGVAAAGGGCTHGQGKGCGHARCEQRESNGNGFHAGDAFIPGVSCQ
jgi:hypothetical protein